MQHIHILGIGGTFMGSLAQLAKAQGFTVTGSDLHVYPPMSTQLEAAGIDLIEGYDPQQVDLQPDVYVVGNAISRGNPLMETILNRGLPYISGPQWLAEHVLRDRWVLAVAGTHGKTTTTSMLTWILHHAGFDPGYLIGGVPQNLPTSAALGSSGFFVVEADEYDSAFFDKRSKFIHYRARTLVLNNLEFDHADIFADLAAIQTQFHHLVRTVPADGLIIYPEQDRALKDVLARGCWTPTQSLNGDWSYQLLEADGSHFRVFHEGLQAGEIKWTLSGLHNVSNGLAAVAAARHVGVQPEVSCSALAQFAGVKRRMELVGTAGGVSVYDDFAHHPTAIATTLEGMRARAGKSATITAVIEPRSNTMRLGVHKDTLAQSCSAADRVFWLEPQGQSWSVGIDGTSTRHTSCRTTEEIIKHLVAAAQPGEHVVIMSNGAFDGIHGKLLEALHARRGS